VITACIISKNEEASIERAIRSLNGISDVLVVDAHSQDTTVEIAQRCGARVLQNAWTGFTDQRNFALKEAKGNWVFFLDADEAATPELIAALKKIDEGHEVDHPHCYSIKRVEFFLGKELNYGPGNPSYQWRFFKKSKVHFVGEVHEYPKFEGPIGTVKDAAIYHWPNLSVERFLTKLNHYTTLEALDRFAQGQRTSLFHAFFTFFTTFLKNGIRYRGFLNGRVGFVLVLLESFSRVVRHLKLWTYWQVYEKKLSIVLSVRLPEPGSRKAIASSELNKESVN
jgi:glycosyltransferase involved in cell wall biosynthesis